VKKKSSRISVLIAGALVSRHRMQSSASARKFRNQNLDLPSEFKMGDSNNAAVSTTVANLIRLAKI
jgi:hypothetical protein